MRDVGGSEIVELLDFTRPERAVVDAYVVDCAGEICAPRLMITYNSATETSQRRCIASSGTITRRCNQCPINIKEKLEVDIELPEGVLNTNMMPFVIV
jgi:hypothetical protein